MNISQTKRYQDYLASDKWREFSTDAKVSTGGRCQGCDKQTWNLSVHHLTYERLGNERASDVWVVCYRCHLRFHRHHKKRVNKERRKQGLPKIRGNLGARKPTRRGLRIEKRASKKSRGSKPWSPEERERLLAEAEQLINSRQV